MYPVSAAFLAAMAAGSQSVIFRADVLSEGVVIATGLKVAPGGSVQVDATATIRRRMSCTVVDETGALIPKKASDVLSPYGYELRLWRGYTTSIGVDELVPLGTFRLAEAHVVDDGAQKIGLSGFDRARSVQRARFETPYVVAAGTNYVTAIQSLITSRLPGTTFSSITTTTTTPLLVFDQASDPWKAAQDMAASIGAEVFFDPLGVCVIRMLPNAQNDATTYTYQEGTTSVLISVDNNLTDDPGYNGVVVDGEAQGATPVHSVVYDVDPTSPTYSLGKYGKVPRFYKSPFVATQQQGDEAALGFLRREKGGTEAMSFSCIPNAAAEGGDVVRVVRAKVGIDATYLLETFAIPLDVTTLSTPTTRRRYTT
jgi:hypothetical protein